MASYLAENRELLSVFTVRMGPFHLPDIRSLLPLLLMWGVAMVIVVFEKDLGSAMVFFFVFLLMLYVATGKKFYLVVGLGLITVGALAAYAAFGQDVYKRQVEHVAVAAPVGGVETRGRSTVEHLDQRVEIAAHVQDGALRVQFASLHLGDDVEELVERAQAAGQGDERIGQRGHARLTGGQVGFANQLGARVHGASLLVQALGDDAYDAAALSLIHISMMLHSAKNAADA